MARRSFHAPARTLAVAVFLVAAGASQATDKCPGYSSCPTLDFPKILSENADALAVRRENAREKRAALLRFDDAGLTDADRKVLLGAILLHDETLSVDKN